MSSAVNSDCDNCSAVVYCAKYQQFHPNGVACWQLRNSYITGDVK